MFPRITALADELDTWDKWDDALFAAILAGNRHGDLLITPAGKVFALEVITGITQLTLIANTAGADGDQGLSSTPPGHSHGFVSPLRFLPGNYEELGAGPKVYIDPYPPIP
jgi:hypothetical protein